jgi:hypothetical protein
MSFVFRLSIASLMIVFVSQSRAAQNAGHSHRGDAAVKKPALVKIERFHRIVFICDSGGAMINKMEVVKDVLTQGIAALKPNQSFDIIFFQEDINEMGKQMTRATDAGKKAAGTFLEGVTTTGTTKPIPALEMAFDLRPDAIYLILESLPEPAKVLKRVEELNKKQKAKIFIVMYADKVAEADADEVKALKAIATETDGDFQLLEPNSSP